MRAWVPIVAGALLLWGGAAVAEPVFPPLQPGGSVVECQAAAPDTPICRVRRDLSEGEARQRLAGRALAFWDEGETFSVVAEDARDQVQLCCAIQAPMARVPGTNLWTLTVRIPQLNHAILDVLIPGAGPKVVVTEWRGSETPPPATVANGLAGAIRRDTIASRHLATSRGLTVYLPPGWVASARYPVAYVADGQTVAAFAEVVEPLILSGAIEPVVLVGVNAGANVQRMRDYLVDFAAGDAGFAGHEAFVLEEVMPFAERTYGASANPKDRLLIGESNGGAWALDMALRHPELFGQAAGLSFGWPIAGRDLGRPIKPRLFLAVGTLEGQFYTRTTEVAQAARAGGYDVRLVTPVSGHSSFMWRDLYPQVFAWAYPRAAAQRSAAEVRAGR